MITTYYDEYGQIIGRTEEYIGSTCVGGNGCDDPYNEMVCPDNGNAGTVNTDYEYAESKQSNWVVAPAPDGGSGSILSLDRMTGKRVASEPQGGHFTEISHYWSTCTFCQSVNPNDVWVENTGRVAIISPQQAKSHVTGHLQYQGRGYDYDNSKTWSFQEVF